MTKAKAERNSPTSDLRKIHQHHDHQHGETCGCKAVKHGDHIDYIRDGHTHRIHGNQLDEREEDLKNPDPLA